MPSFADRIKPWDCAACGKRNISANKTVCPECYAVRGETAPNHEAIAATVAAQAAEAAKPGQVTRIYTGEKAMRKGIDRMAKQGWRVVSQSSHQPRAGVGRMVALGLFAAVFKPPMRFTVVYER